MNDNFFELLKENPNGEVVAIKYCGAWLIVDDCYLDWSVTIPPMRQTMFYKETRWSEWMESMRKDVECTFGILKGRWGILKAGISCHGVDITDEIWMTCCALHNMLLDKDGLSEEWEGELGEFYWNKKSENIPFAIQRLHTTSERRKYDTSGMGPGLSTNDDIAYVDVDNSIKISPETINFVHQLPMDTFRARLIEHLDILFKQNKVVWPTRMNGSNRKKPTI